MTGERFFNFVRGSLIPNMLPFNGVNPVSVAVMDNCSVHHVQEVKQLFKDAGILLFFLPPYSPDMNPIEETFSFVKTYLRAHDELLQAIHNPIICYPSSIRQHNTISLQLMDQSFGLPTVDIQQLPIT